MAEGMVVEWLNDEPYDPNKLNRVVNDPLDMYIIQKPRGGLWTSPVDDPDNWRSTEIGSSQHRFVCTLPYDWRWLVVDGPDSLRRVLDTYGIEPGHRFEFHAAQDQRVINWIHLSDDWDVFYLTGEGHYSTRLTLTEATTYGWDCSTTLILDPLRHPEVFVNVPV